MSEEIRILKRDLTWLQDRHGSYEKIRGDIITKYFMESTGHDQVCNAISLAHLMLSSLQIDVKRKRMPKTILFTPWSHIETKTRYRRSDSSEQDSWADDPISK
jgi:hypothetical protein